jgi:hypothetical protein
MTRVAAAKPAAVKLPIEKVVAWRLGRQRLAGTPATDPTTVARELVGVQAQVLTSAALAVAIRSEGGVQATGVALSERRLVRRDARPDADRSGGPGHQLRDGQVVDDSRPAPDTHPAAEVR